MSINLIIETSYLSTLNNLKKMIQKARYKASISANKELILLYWEIGNTIIEKQKANKWGSKFIDRLSEDLRKSFPGSSGFSNRNLKYMRKFALCYRKKSIVQPVVAQLPWRHNITLIEKLQSAEERLWYARAAYSNGWSRDSLVHQIEAGLYKRQALGQKTTNFKHSLPPGQSELAQHVIKDPYIFDFLDLNARSKEKELEEGLTAHITRFLLELGRGFAFIGRQYHLEVAGQDFYIDLLFYHVELRCYVAVELKIGDFKPEYAGQINFYLSAIDKHLKHKDDNPSIGIIICKTKNRIIAEYALSDLNKPIGVSEYRLSKHIPDRLKKGLPSSDQIENEFV